MRAGEQASMQQWQLKDRISALESDGGMGPLSPKALRWAQELQEAAAEAEQLCSELKTQHEAEVGSLRAQLHEVTVSAEQQRYDAVQELQNQSIEVQRSSLKTRKYDLSGDGVLSETEMKNVFGKVHEFISWLTAQKTPVKGIQDTKQKNVTLHIINTSDRVSRRFTFTFNGCKNMAFPLGKPLEVLLRPGEEFSKVILEVEEKEKSWKWNFRWSSRSEFAGVEDDPNAFQDGDFPHDDSSIGKSSTKFNVGSKYVVQLFDIGTEAWTETTVDEFIPCNIKNGVAVPTFARPMGEEIWVQLVEKAMAKFCGSYGDLSGGGVAWAFQVLTGTINVLSFEKLSENSWRRRFMHQQKQLERGARNPRSSWWKWQNKDTHDTNQLFELLQSHRRQDHILSCMIAGESEGTETAKSNGLYLRHYYAVLKVVSEAQDDGTEVHLILLRNPWGRNEWSGDWSDSSEKWEQNPNLMAKLDTQVRNDGSFWMNFEEWASMFTLVVVCPSSGSPPPDDAESFEEAPESDNVMSSFLDD
eukprot:s1099_g4.t2